MFQFPVRGIHAWILVTALVTTNLASAGEAVIRDRLGEKIDLAKIIPEAGRDKAQAGNHPVVIAFLSFECPVARDYLTTLSVLAGEFSDRGVRVIGFVPTEESPAEVARKAREYKSSFPIFSDADQKAVAALKASGVPEVFVFDANGTLLYRGRIDDKYGARLKPNARITRHDLRLALDEVLASKPVSVPATAVVGCPIQPNEIRPADSAKFTFHRDVLPILQNRCQECHRPGEVGPFSLMTHKQTLNWAKDVKETARNRTMPPWKPVEGVDFKHDRRMTEREINILAEWADAGAPEGNPADAPPEKKFTRGWSMGEPDLVLEMKEEFHLAANGPDHFQCVVLPTGLTEDKFLIGFEVRPGNPRILHHAVNYTDISGRARQLDSDARKQSPGPDHGPGYESPMGIGFTPKKVGEIGVFGGWTPGMRGQRSPDGAGYLMPKGSDVVMQLHYHRTGKPETDRTKVGLYFSKSKELSRLKLLTVPGLLASSDGLKPFDTIPAGASKHRVIGKVVVEEECEAHSVLPHMHMLGKKIRVGLTAPGEKERTIVRIDDWDYNWQEGYRFAHSFKISAGTIITVEAEFDNSASNPNNPSSPPRVVRKGEGTTDEMLFAFLRVTSAGIGELKIRRLTDAADYVRNDR